MCVYIYIYMCMCVCIFICTCLDTYADEKWKAMRASAIASFGNPKLMSEYSRIVTEETSSLVRRLQVDLDTCMYLYRCSQLQIGWHRISRLFLKLFQRTRILPMIFRLVPSNKRKKKDFGTPGTKSKVFRNNLKMLCHPICNWLYIQR